MNNRIQLGYLIALILLTIANIAPAREINEEPYSAAVTNLELPQVVPIPLPVEIVSDRVTSENAARLFAETRQREIDDLVAQQNMSEATKAMNRATQKMANYALWSTIAVCVGTALLIWNLVQFSRSNRVAFEGVKVNSEMFKHQLRAYIAVSGDDRFSVFVEPTRIYMKIKYTNCGMVPAKDIEFKGESYVMRGTNKICITQIDDKHGGMAPKDSAVIGVTLPNSDVNARNRWGKVTVFVKGTFKYMNGFDDLCTTGFSLKFGIDNDTLDEHFEFVPEENNFA